MTLYHLNVTVHLLSAFVWLGGMFFLAAVGAPVLRKVEPPELRATLFRRLGEQFRRVGWIAVAVLVATGVGNLYFRGLLSWRILGSAEFWQTGYAHALGLKLATVAAMIALSALHDFVLGPRASRARPGTDTAFRFRRWSSLVARANALIGIVLVYAAVLLTRGG